MRRQKYDEVQMSLDLLSKMICHFDRENFNGLDVRSYFLTIPVKSKGCFQFILPVIYTKVRKAFGFGDGKDGDQIGMLAAGDIRGTRKNQVREYDRSGPHIHAVMILPKRLAPKDALQEKKLMQDIANEIGKIREVSTAVRDLSRAGDATWIRPIYGGMVGMLKSIFYTIKADQNFSGQFGEAFAFKIFPLEQKKSLLHRQAAFEVSEDLRVKMYCYPEAYFSDVHYNMICDEQRVVFEQLKISRDWTRNQGLPGRVKRIFRNEGISNLLT